MISYLVMETLLNQYEGVLKCNVGNEPQCPQLASDWEPLLRVIPHLSLHSCYLGSVVDQLNAYTEKELLL